MNIDKELDEELLETMKVSMSVDFNDTHRYELTVEIPIELPGDHALKLVGVNSAGLRFELGSAGRILMRFLRVLGHADMVSGPFDGDRFDTWQLHPEPHGRQFGALLRILRKEVGLGNSEARTEQERSHGKGSSEAGQSN